MKPVFIAPRRLVGRFCLGQRQLVPPGVRHIFVGYLYGQGGLADSRVVEQPYLNQLIQRF
ncbi:hypothetical protein DV711_02120 [Motiliproteus coralliicola]|uniref:Uncharacterized protein n=1 Tax=Motiliproteus coralliicola TaxID=2283196 RepID=A0A369WRX3_9GAMM|nr:hypothetical protein DV711_02120 [Motiliproteus coralliicola]